MTTELTVIPLRQNEIEEQARKKGCLFVVNNTDRGRTQSRGEYYIEIMDDNNRPYALKVPNTWVPIDLATYVKIEDLFKSNAFREGVRKQIIIGITEEAALALLETSEARKEHARISAIMNAQEGGIVQQMNQFTIQPSSSGTPIETPRANAQDDQRMPENDAALFSLVKQFNENKISEDTACTQLENLNPPPSSDSLKDAAGSINMHSSRFNLLLAEMIGRGGRGPSGNTDANAAVTPYVPFRN